MDTQVADTLLGSLIDGRYRIRGRVARGGMATVYTATDERLERTVAVKIIHPSQAPEARARTTGFVARFTDEAKTIARLTHPNVVAVYDQGTHSGLPYLVMEYVRGRTLRDVLAERRRLNPDEALAIAEQMLAAIAAAHRAGLVHRDVKPENVLVAEAPTGGTANLVDSVVKVADFGLARAVEASADDENGNQLMATVAYVAPELVTDGHADPRTDVYSAGIVLFEMLTGRVPYDGDRPVDVAWQHVDNDVPAPSTLVPGLPKALDELVARATRRDPGARPTDAGALLAEVQAVRDDLGDADANSRTAVLRRVSDEPMAGPTMMVAAVRPAERPAWARLPEGGAPRAGRRRAEPEEGESLWSRLSALRTQVMGDPRGRMAVVAAVVVLVLVAAGGGWWFGAGRYTEAPQLVAMTKADAEAQAARAGFVLSYADPRYDEKVPKDAVLAQDPASASRIVKGDTITLTLSMGPERFPVPDVVGKEFELAEADLLAAKLVVAKGTARYDDNLPSGVVVAVNPEAGTEVKPGDKVTVILSKGKAPISVPNLVGKSLGEARTILAQLGLVLVEPPTYKDSDKPRDEVLGQSPADGSGVERGAKVKLELSKGPPLVVVPRVIDLPCQQAKQQLESQGFPVAIQFNPNGIVRFQNPENTEVPPGTPVTLGCM
ncbi:Stk1 family PASTA domain-containing Ser/Thr kinase [Micromonospora peucetia]|uniref:non-specific serine/threonine protein kinase n=1 Tax=Micromonospora peucetia TaxID=47871 RepID=A0A1C6VQY0_9ACTN|nr:Stk1 family PASTA domain-containing Ser/Thr kinase [Micromonospora peucetia]MCX4388552.1 Stk1 family PASTA domain-containing Ser/Thr kinase [Micromonospora peucetia]WSA30792.1 Stk1 family PASTA domain-containing Ser/Thr kinase [Micromonospora peucetia]SCL68340.1 serine/threonine protein kinase [Micromonospora peucetia]